MYIALSYAGIRQHILLLEEEKRKTASLKETVQMTAQLAALNPDFNPRVYQNCLDDLELLERGIAWRMEFLENMVDDFQRIANENKERFDDLQIRLERIHG